MKWDKKGEKVNYYYPRITKIKILCTMLVVAVHTNPLKHISPVINDYYINVIARIAVPFFFICSGFILARNLEIKPEGSLSHYIKALIRQYMFWFLIYIPIGISQLQTVNPSYINSSPEFNFLSFIIRIVEVVFIFGSSYHLWFFPALIFGTWVVGWFIRNNRLNLLLILSGLLFVAGSIESYYTVFSTALEGSFIMRLIDLYFDIFITTRNGLFMALLFITIGALVYQKEISISDNFLIPAISIGFVLIVAEGLLIQTIGPLDQNFMYMSIPLSTALFLWSVKVKTETASFLYKGLEASLKYVYVLHILVMTILLKTDMRMMNGMIFIMSLMIPAAIGGIMLVGKTGYKRMPYIMGRRASGQ